MMDTDSGIAGVGALAVDCRDPARLAQFWTALLGGAVTDVDDDGNTTVTSPEGLNLDFFGVPEPKTVKNRLHLDLRSTDFDRAVRRALELGATKADDIYAGDDWQVLRDPEGNEFCILRPH
jgi:catechol 2,3-dioxygenase-like lactoylglutathione lyase family enzyme